MHKICTCLMYFCNVCVPTLSKQPINLCFVRYPELESTANEHYGGVPAMAKKWAKVIRKRANNERAIQVRLFGC